MKKSKKYFGAQEGVSFWHNHIVQWVNIGVIVTHLILWGVIVTFVRPQEFLIKFHFNAFFGVDLLAQWYYVYLFPIFGLMIVIVNSILAYWCYKWQERIAAYILLLALLFFHISALIASGAIIIINR